MVMLRSLNQIGWYELVNVIFSENMCHIYMKQKKILIIYQQKFVDYEKN